MRIVQRKKRFILGTYGDWKGYNWDIMGKSLNLVIWYCNQMWFAGKSSCKRKFLAGKINYKWVIFDCHFWSPEDILPIHGGPAYDWDTMECHGKWIWMKKYHNLIGWKVYLCFASNSWRTCWFSTSKQLRLTNKMWGCRERNNIWFHKWHLDCISHRPTSL